MDERDGCCGSERMLRTGPSYGQRSSSAGLKFRGAIRTILKTP
jgi:deferrochelatase/peroxidase EfeB